MIINKTDRPQPLISVMIPVYQPNDYLLKTLGGVLQQADDFAPAAMQIVLLDDASPTVSVPDMIRSLPNIDRVEVKRNESNLGLAGNWNRSIEIARGEFIHILHQDDIVLPGFYKKLCGSLQQHSQIGMAFCRHAIIGADDKVQRVSHRERWFSGTLNHWIPRIAMRTRIQCPAAIVRRSTYEAIGNFRTDLRYSLDWEMWVRIAVHFPVWYEPSMLAMYRRHAENESARLAAIGAQEPDLLKTIEIFSSYLPAPERDAIIQGAYEYLIRSTLKRCKKIIESESRQSIAILFEHIKNMIDRLPMNRLRSRFQGQWDRLHALMDAHD